MRTLIRLRVGRAAARAELVRGGRVLWAAESGLASAGELGEAVSALLARSDLPRRPDGMRIELDPSVTQLRTLHGLPPIRPAQLRALIATQSGRFFRRNGHPLVTDAAWTGGRRVRKAAVAAAVEEPWVRAAIEGARLAGVAVEMVVPVPAPPGVRLDLLPDDERRRRRRDALVKVRSLALLAAAAWLAAGAIWLVRLSRARQAVERDIAAVEAPHRALAAARRAMREAGDILAAVERERDERTAVVRAVAGIGAALPDSAMVTGLTADRTGRGELSVVARRAGLVQAALEQASPVASPRMTGAVLRESVGGKNWERFTVTFGGGS